MFRNFQGISNSVITIINLLEIITVLLYKENFVFLQLKMEYTVPSRNVVSENLCGRRYTIKTHPSIYCSVVGYKTTLLV